jgi:hypothetical protein
MMAGEMSKIEIRNNFLLERARLPKAPATLWSSGVRACRRLCV